MLPRDPNPTPSDLRIHRDQLAAAELEPHELRQVGEGGVGDAAEGVAGEDLGEERKRGGRGVPAVIMELLKCSGNALYTCESSELYLIHGIFQIAT